tara:strand:- start:4734 stop:5612 length:879 start_codon:yes stop_codon:yes gene_type:complete
MNNIENINYNLTNKDINEIKYVGVFIIILIIIIYKNAFENNNYSCNNILVNTYLYVLISLLLFHVITLLLINANLHKKYMYYLKNTNIIVSLIFMLGLFFGLFSLFNMYYNNILFSHLILLILIGVFSLFTSLIYVILKKYNLYNKVFYTTLLFVMVLLIIFYFKQDLIKKYLNDEYYFIILILLFVILIVEIIYMLFMGYNKNITVTISACVLLIFGYFLLKNTEKIINITEKNCNIALKNCNENTKNVRGYNNNCNLEDYPNYPQKSFNIFQDIIIIFKRIADIYLATRD